MYRMDRNLIVRQIQQQQQALQKLGVKSLSLFGSVARGEMTEASDIDVAVILDPAQTPRGFHYIGRLEALQHELEAILGHSVDVVAEPATKKQFQAQIEKDRVVAF